MTNRLMVLVVVASIFTLAACSAIRGKAQDSGTPTMTTEDVRPAPTSTDGDPNAEIVWFDDLDAAAGQAQTGQVIFIDVYTDWCSWCKYMDRKIYTDPQVRALASKHVFVKLDAEDGGKGEAFARRNGVRGYPTLIIMSGDQQPLASQPGAFRQPGDFMRWFEAAASRAT